MYPIYVWLVFPESQIWLLLTLRPAVFAVHSIFKKCTKWPQMTLNLTRPKVPHICVTNIHISQMSLRFALRPAVFKIQATFFRNVHWMTPKWPGALQDWKNCAYVSQAPYFTPFRSTAIRFQYTGHFEKSAPNDPVTGYVNLLWDNKDNFIFGS